MALFVPFLLYMRKNIFGRKFKRDTNERTALFKGLLSSLVLKERIKTTEAKAKAIKAEADKIVTRAKKSQAERLSSDYLTPNAVKKMIYDIAPGFKDRNGGYTRIVRLGNRFSDNASMVVMEWVERAEVVKPQVTELKKGARKRKVSTSKETKKPARKTSKKVRKNPDSRKTTKSKSEKRKE